MCPNYILHCDGVGINTNLSENNCVTSASSAEPLKFHELQTVWLTMAVTADETKAYAMPFEKGSWKLLFLNGLLYFYLGYTMSL